MLSNVAVALRSASGRTMTLRVRVREVALASGQQWRANSVAFFKENLTSILAYGSAVTVLLGLLYVVTLSKLLGFNMLAWSSIDDLLLFGAKASPPVIVVVVLTIAFYVLARAWASGASAVARTRMSRISRLFSRIIAYVSPASVLGSALLFAIGATLAFSWWMARDIRVEKTKTVVALNDRETSLETRGVIGRTSDYIFLYDVKGGGGVVSIPKERVMCVASGDQHDRIKDACGLRAAVHTVEPADNVESIANVRDYARFMENCSIPRGAAIPSVEFRFDSARRVTRWYHEPEDNFGLSSLPCDRCDSLFGQSVQSVSDMDQSDIDIRSAIPVLQQALRHTRVRTLLIVGLASDPASPTYNLDLAARRTEYVRAVLCSWLENDQFTCEQRARATPINTRSGKEHQIHITRRSDGHEIDIRLRAIGKNLLTGQRAEGRPAVDQRVAVVPCE
jgi:hypothetical protein